jgi:hypothetical protein
VAVVMIPIGHGLPNVSFGNCGPLTTAI